MLGISAVDCFTPGRNARAHVAFRSSLTEALKVTTPGTSAAPKATIRKSAAISPGDVRNSLVNCAARLRVNRGRIVSTVSTYFWINCGWRPLARLPPATLFNGRKDPRIRQVAAGGGCDSLCSLCPAPKIGHGVYSRRQFLANAAIASSLSCARILFRVVQHAKR
jgi:hypothetical protein